MNSPGISTENEKSDQEEKTPNSLTSTWGFEVTGMVCEGCDWNYLLPVSTPAPICPHCFKSPLTPMTDQIDKLPYTQPPELVLPFAFPNARLPNAIQEFTRGIPFAPEDLTTKNLHNRLKRLFLPMWLVDVNVEASWKAETGFDYQVVSHVDRYEENRGGWVSREVEENRVRWEPRFGLLSREYQNIAAPALEEHTKLKKNLGEFDLSTSVIFRPEEVDEAFIRIPNRTSEDAWTDAKPVIQTAAAEECRQAADADHIRQFFWEAEHQNQNWSLLLLPVFTTFYMDDNNLPQLILLHGQTGRMSGKRQASMNRGRRTALSILIVSVLFFLFSLLISAASLFLPALLAIGVMGFVIALIIGLGAVIPIATVWWYNRNH